MNELKTAHYTEHLEQENAQLKQQLAEKEKEIEQLKEECNKLSDREFEHFGDMKTYKNMWLKEQKQSVKLRHKICEKIRNLAGDYFEFPICENCGETLFASSDVIMTGSDFEKILQEVEKGEE